VIHAAFLRLAKTYHPDVNRSGGGDMKMKELNAAYDVLGDPARRAEYDRSIGIGVAEPTSTGTPREAAEGSNDKQEDIPAVGCQVCGVVDSTLRFSVFLWVYSFVIFSARRGAVGIWCAQHRAREGTKYNVMTVLLGPWGPWGIVWSIQALIDNFKGGRQPADINGPLLATTASYLLRTDRYEEGAKALASSVLFDRNAQNQTVLAGLLNWMPSLNRTAAIARGRAGIFATGPAIITASAFAAAVGVLTALIILLAAGGRSSSMGSTGSQPAPPVSSGSVSPPPNTSLAVHDTGQANGGSMTVSGTVQNTSNWDTINLVVKVELFDSRGATLHTLNTSVGTLAAHGQAPFSATQYCPSCTHYQTSITWHWRQP
jgi:curved DNA-binding protein CbpA